MMQSFANHPLARQIREYAEQMRNGAANASDNEHTGNNNNNGAARDGDVFDEQTAFVPPVDVFNGPDAWIVHIALPGAKKEDTGVSWDAERSSLSIAGVVHRPGDEEFLSTLVGSGERRVGLFERKVRIPPADAERKEGEEVDGEGVVARMEDGLLIVKVPKVEREWTQVRKVDIE